MSSPDWQFLETELQNVAEASEGLIRWQDIQRQRDGLEARFSVELRIIADVVRGAPEFSRLSSYVLQVPRDFPHVQPEFRVARGGDLPFHPFFDQHGLWHSEHLNHPPDSLAKWMAAFVRSLCLDFSPARLQRAVFQNEEAGRWLLEAWVHDPRLAPTESEETLQRFDDAMRQAWEGTARGHAGEIGEPRSQGRRFQLSSSSSHSEGNPPPLISSGASGGEPPAQHPPPLGQSPSSHAEPPRLVIHRDPPPRPRKKFQLGAMTQPYTPRERPVPTNLRFGDGVSNRLRGGSSRYYVTVLAEAARKLHDHIGWGDHHRRDNRVEQGGILLGHVYQDPQRDCNYGVVEDIVPGRAGRGSSTYLELGTEVWKSMLDYVDETLEQTGNDMQVIGWYHTHPNNLGVFMSGTDMATQRRFFSEDWHFALVLNPHHQVFKAFHGARATECHGNILFDSTTRSGGPIQEGPDDVFEPPPEEVDPPTEGSEDPGEMPGEGSRNPYEEPPAGSEPYWVFRVPKPPRAVRRLLWVPVAMVTLGVSGVFFYSLAGFGGEADANPDGLISVAVEDGQRMALFESSTGKKTKARLHSEFQVRVLDRPADDRRVRVEAVLEGWINSKALAPDVVVPPDAPPVVPPDAPPVVPPDAPPVVPPVVSPDDPRTSNPPDSEAPDSEAPDSEALDSEAPDSNATSAEPADSGPDLQVDTPDEEATPQGGDETTPQEPETASPDSSQADGVVEGARDGGSEVVGSDVEDSKTEDSKTEDSETENDAIDSRLRLGNS